MKIDLDLNTEGKNIINAYDDNSVTVNGVSYQSSLIVSPNRLVEDWGPQSFAELREQDFEQIMTFRPEIVLLGTGRTHRFPTYDLTENLALKRIGLEVMDTGAACRAYNFLVGEDREVVAALWLSD